MKELQFLMYTTPQENIKIDVVVKDETIWLTQKTMAALFDVQVPAISKHLKNIFEEGEVEEKVAVSILEITTQHGAIAEKTQNIETRFYNLDAIISVGYRVNSAKATQFRIWATKTLKEFIIKGFVLDDERLKQGQTAFGTHHCWINLVIEPLTVIALRAVIEPRAVIAGMTRNPLYNSAILFRIKHGMMVQDDRQKRKSVA